MTIVQDGERVSESVSELAQGCVDDCAERMVMNANNLLIISGRGTMNEGEMFCFLLAAKMMASNILQTIENQHPGILAVKR